MPDPLNNYFFRREDMLVIENVLYEVKKEELVARQFLSINNSFPEYALEVGYDWYDMEGSAKILASGASAKDIPFVGEKSGRETQKVYTISTGIKYTLAERMAAEAKAAQGKGPGVSLDTIRVAAARRLIAETENRIVFLGDKDHKIVGLLDHAGTTKKDVAEGAKGSTAAEKRLWSNKTPQEILEDLRLAKAEIEKKNIFRARVLLLDSNHYSSLIRPFSESSPLTVLNWLETQGHYFEQIVVSNQMSAELNGFEKGAFVLMDNSPEIIQLALTYDMRLGNPVYDILWTSEQAVFEGTAGIILRHPSAIYIGKGC